MSSIISARRAPFPESNVHLGCTLQGTTNVGTLRPVAFFPIVPGDDVFFSGAGLIRPLPIKLPFLSKLDVKFDMFFVPYKLYNKSLRDNNVATFNPQSVVFPQISFAPPFNVPFSSYKPNTVESSSRAVYPFENIASRANRAARADYYSQISKYATTGGSVDSVVSIPWVEPGSFMNLAGLPVGFFNAQPTLSSASSPYSSPARRRYAFLRYLGYADIFRNYYANLQTRLAYFAPVKIYNQVTSEDAAETSSNQLAEVRSAAAPLRLAFPCSYLDQFIEDAYTFTPSDFPSDTSIGAPAAVDFVMSAYDLRHLATFPRNPFRITENYCTRDGMLFCRSMAPYYEESWISKSVYDAGPGSVSVSVEDDQVLVSSVRSGSKILKFEELTAAGGYRYDDFLSVQFDVKTTADTTVPVYLGSAHGTIASDPIYQMAPGESQDTGIGSGVGAIGGTAMGTIGISPRRWSFHEFGDIICIMSLMPDVTYFQSMDPFLEKTTLNSLYYPSLDRLGFQPLMERHAGTPLSYVAFPVTDSGIIDSTPEGWASGKYSFGIDVSLSSNSSPLAGSSPYLYDMALGYQPAWSEYTRCQSRVSGDLATSLRPWAFTRLPGDALRADALKITDSLRSVPGVSERYGWLQDSAFQFPQTVDITILDQDDTSSIGTVLFPIRERDTYVHPYNWNYLFEDIRADAHNFIYELRIQCDVRRQKSKLNMPTFGL